MTLRAYVDDSIRKGPLADRDRPQKPVAEAMREMLETFRLPGESQQINRITETFAEIYFASGPG